MKIICINAEKQIGFKERKMGKFCNKLEEDEQLKKISKQKDILTNASLALKHVQRTKTIPQTVYKVYNVDEQYQPAKIEVQQLINNGQLIKEFKKDINQKIKQVQSDLEKCKSKKTHEFIQNKVDEIRNERINDHSKFFKRTDPDSIYSNQQLYCVKTKVSSINPETGLMEEHTIISNNGNIVADEVFNTWNNIFQSHTPKKTQPLKIFSQGIFQEKRNKVIGKDTDLTELCTNEEVYETLKEIKNGKQPGPDRLNNELFKWLKDSEIFLTIFTNIINTIILTETFPKSWKRSYVYLIYKKEKQLIHSTTDQLLC